MTKRVSTEQCEAALTTHAGIVALAAKDLGVSRQALHERVKKNKRLQKAIYNIKETLKDGAEGVIAEAIVKKKDLATARWYLERQGADRGFATKTEARLADDQVDAILAALGPEVLAQLRMALNGG